MIVPILAVCLVVTTPVLVYTASTWPNERQSNLAAREQRERFFDDLAAHQAARLEMDRSAFEGRERSRPVQGW